MILNIIKLNAVTRNRVLIVPIYLYITNMYSVHALRAVFKATIIVDDMFGSLEVYIEQFSLYDKSLRSKNDFY